MEWELVTIKLQIEQPGVLNDPASLGLLVALVRRVERIPP